MFLNWILKKRYKVISASPIESRDVTLGFDKRNVKKQKIAIIGKKKMQYSQQLIIKRGQVIKSIKVFVNHRIKNHKNKTTELILKPKKQGDTIRL